MWVSGLGNKMTYVPSPPLVGRQAYDAVKANEIRWDFYWTSRGFCPAELEFRRMWTWSCQEWPNFWPRMKAMQQTALLRGEKKHYLSSWIISWCSCCKFLDRKLVQELSELNEGQDQLLGFPVFLINLLCVLLKPAWAGFLSFAGS